MTHTCVTHTCVTHTCVSNLTIIGSDNGLSSGRRQAIIRTNTGILLIGASVRSKFIHVHTRKCTSRCCLRNGVNFVSASYYQITDMYKADYKTSLLWRSCSQITVAASWGRLGDMQNCALRMCQECRERYPSHRLQRKSLVSDPDTHHGTCVMHVPWCMSTSVTRGGGENVPVIPGACTTRNFAYLVRGSRKGLSCWNSFRRWFIVYWLQDIISPDVILSTDIP